MTAEEIYNEFMNKDYLGVRVTTKDRIIHAIEFASQKDAWIKVSDRLPNEQEQTKTIIVHTEHGAIYEAEYNGVNFQNPYYGQDITGNFNDVTHWTIPTPPND